MMLAVQRGRRSSNLLRYAAARAALWLYHDLPALLETLLFPHKVRVLSFAQHIPGLQVALSTKTSSKSCTAAGRVRASPVSQPDAHLCRADEALLAPNCTRENIADEAVAHACRACRCRALSWSSSAAS